MRLRAVNFDVSVTVNSLAFISILVKQRDPNSIKISLLLPYNKWYTRKYMCRRTSSYKALGWLTLFVFIMVSNKISSILYCFLFWKMFVVKYKLYRMPKETGKISRWKEICKTNFALSAVICRQRFKQQNITSVECALLWKGAIQMHMALYTYICKYTYINN